MKRSFLKNLGLEDEVINQIMKEHGSTVQSLNDTIDDLRDSNSELKKDVVAKEKSYTELETEHKTAQGKITELEKSIGDVDSLKDQVKDWEDKWNARDFDEAVKDHISGYNFTSELAKKATLNELKAQNFKLKDGKLDGADEFMKEFMENNKTAFVIDGDDGDNKPATNEPQPPQSPYIYKPSGGNGDDDLKSFEAQLDNLAKM